MAAKPSANVIAHAAAAIRTQWSAVWPHIGQDLRRACVDQRVTVAAVAQDADTVSVEWMDALRDALHREMGTI